MRSIIVGLLALPALAYACGGDSKKGGDQDADADVTTATDTDADSDGDTQLACGGQTGVLDCPCRPDDSCDGALTCQDGVCKTPVVEAHGLVLPAGARGCEVLLAEAGGAVSEVHFAASVHGTFIREAPRVAIAVVSAADADFAAGAVEVVSSATPPATVVSARCVDAAGAVISGATVSFR
ncbi:MAG: hypothetical protein U1F43_32510 [Myxococcota bacterium]